jgi:hypothetical protein
MQHFSMCSALGGEEGFKQIISRARALNMRILVDATTRISAKGAHRKYRNMYCQTLDEHGNRKV